MPKDTRARTRAVRAHMAATGLGYTAAAAALDAPFKPLLTGQPQRVVGATRR